ncbi:MAG: hypothetical protein M1838_004139 [Thelocarpon superellum]|nr:MAG: hypothetical protein M1838_004139 [Thelocarpon superellum]
MAIPRRLYLLIGAVIIFCGVFTYVGFGNTTRSDFGAYVSIPGSGEQQAGSDHRGPTEHKVQSTAVQGEEARPTFRPGVVKLPGSNYTRVLVIARIKSENVSWIEEELPQEEAVIYVADDPTASLHPPRNKGHEVMIYLTYIIDHYDALPEIVLFMHSHRWTHHNNDLQGADAVRLVKTLSNERVVREGYMNLRCHWHEGCPGHLHPLSTEPDFHQMQSIMARQWRQIFPSIPVPESLAQPCCAQFAVSRERLRAIPLAEFISYRDWLLRTPLTDYYSGRIWEYLWQFVFTGKSVLCPAEHICYCDGFGLCFGSDEAYGDHTSLHQRQKTLEHDLNEWHRQDDALRRYHAAMSTSRPTGPFSSPPAPVETPALGRDIYLRDQIDALKRELEARLAAAELRGADPRLRAEEAGRAWREGER